jgi:hypothetical protein
VEILGKKKKADRKLEKEIPVHTVDKSSRKLEIGKKKM